jgi:hypothetical protein
MSKTNDTKKIRELTEAELDAVSGGVIKAMGNPKWDVVELRRGMLDAPPPIWR